MKTNEVRWRRFQSLRGRLLGEAHCCTTVHEVQNIGTCFLFSVICCRSISASSSVLLHFTLPLGMPLYCFVISVISSLSVLFVFLLSSAQPHEERAGPKRRRRRRRRAMVLRVHHENKASANGTKHMHAHWCSSSSSSTVMFARDVHTYLWSSYGQ